MKFYTSMTFVVNFLDLISVRISFVFLYLCLKWIDLLVPCEFPVEVERKGNRRAVCKFKEMKG